MLQRLLLTGLLSGAIAGIVLTIAHLTLVQPLIVKAEIFEKSLSAPAVNVRHVHQAGFAHIHEGGNVPHLHKKNFHIHAEGTAHVHPNTKKGHTHAEQKKTVKQDHGVHSHIENVWSPQDGIERSLYTLAANILTAIAFGLLLVSGYTVYGGSVTLLQGFFWGVAGFSCFTFLPGLGLPPELPASVSGDLLARQIWWLGTAALSVAGLSFLVFGYSNAWRAVGLLLLIIPHAIGAPHPVVGAVGASPPELAAHFVMVSLFASAIMWSVLGVAAAFLFDRFLVEDPTSYSRTSAN